MPKIMQIFTGPGGPTGMFPRVDCLLRGWLVSYLLAKGR